MLLLLAEGASALVFLLSVEGPASLVLDFDAVEVSFALVVLLALNERAASRIAWGSDALVLLLPDDASPIIVRFLVCFGVLDSAYSCHLDFGCWGGLVVDR